MTSTIGCFDHRVTQLVIDRSSIRIQTWSLEGSGDVRLAAPFVVNLASGAARRRPSDTERLSPCLALVGLGVRSVTVTRTGTLTLAFSDGSSLSASPDPGDPRGTSREAAFSREWRTRTARSRAW
jgi:hypothetical protein